MQAQCGYLVQKKPDEPVFESLDHRASHFTIDTWWLMANFRLSENTFS